MHVDFVNTNNDLFVARVSFRFLYIMGCKAQVFEPERVLSWTQPVSSWCIYVLRFHTCEFYGSRPHAGATGLPSNVWTLAQPGVIFGDENQLT